MFSEQASNLIRIFIHYGGHFILPIILWWTIKHVFYKKLLLNRNICIMLLLGNAIDIDHLFASPIFEPNRCSIGFHYLHQWYFLLLFITIALILFKKRPYLSALFFSAIIHMVIDYQDCLWMPLS